MPKAFLFFRCGSPCLTFSRSSFTLFSMHLLMPTKLQREKDSRFLCAPRRKGHRLCYRSRQNKRLKHMGASLPGLSLEGTLFLEKDTIRVNVLSRHGTAARIVCAQYFLCEHCLVCSQAKRTQLCFVRNRKENALRKS